VTYKNRAIGIRWKCGNRIGEVTAGTYDRDEAIGARAILIDELNRGIFPNSQARGPGITWAAFRERYQTEYLPTLSDGSRSAWITAANWLEKAINPRLLAEIDKGSLSAFRGVLLSEELSDNSVASYLRTIRAALGWAYDMDLLHNPPPKVRARKGLKRDAGMRSRPITGEEFDRILLAVPKVRPKDPADWERFLRGLWESSLRVDELRRLSWDKSAELAIDVTGRYPMIRMLAEGHKSRADCYQPITPEFWQVITMRGFSRTGYAFPLPGRRGQQMTRKRVIRTIGEIGRKAGVVTDSASGKCATSHDIGRRATLTRLASKLTTSQTQQFARHSDPRTTSTYYVRFTAESLAEAVGWSVANALTPSREGAPLAPCANSVSVELPKTCEAEGTGVEPASP